MVKNYRLSSKYYICLILLIIPFSNSLGFDFYSHVVAFSSYEELPKVYKNYFFEGGYIPRYLLLSIFYELVARLGIPLGYVIIILLIVPSAMIFGEKSTIYGFVTGNRIIDFIVYFLISMLVVVLTFFYSALSLTLLWALAYRFTRNNILVLCCLFHPLSMVIFFVVGGASAFYKAFLVYLSFILLIMINYHYGLIELYSLKKSDKTIDLLSMDFSVIYSKTTELIFSFTILIFVKYKLGKPVIKKKAANYSINKCVVLPTVFILMLALVFFMSAKKTPINALVFGWDNIVIDAAWFGIDNGGGADKLTYARYN